MVPRYFGSTMQHTTVRGNGATRWQLAGRRDEIQYPEEDVARASAYTSIYTEDPHKILSLLVV